MSRCDSCANYWSGRSKADSIKHLTTYVYGEGKVSVWAFPRMSKIFAVSHTRAAEIKAQAEMRESVAGVKRDLAGFVENHKGIWLGLKAMREDAGLTLEQVSDRTGWALEDIKRIEDGVEGVKFLQAMDDIAKVCGGFLRVEMLKPIKGGVHYFAIW